MKINRVAISVGLCFVMLSACSGSSSNDSSSSRTTPTESPMETTAPPVDTTIQSERLVVLVTNDDGIDGAGIDAVVNELTKDPDLDVVVWAPATNQSGTGDKTTPGGLPGVAAATASGVAGYSVAGFPADSVNAALTANVVPDVVISGINAGQNIGPFVKISGTVGAAATATRLGYWALAVSQGIAETPAFETAAPLVAEWLAQHKQDIIDKKPARLFNLNVPTCASGSLRPLTSAPPAADFGTRKAVTISCDGPDLGPSGAADDVDAFIAGHAVMSELNAITLASVS